MKGGALSRPVGLPPRSTHPMSDLHTPTLLVVRPPRWAARAGLAALLVFAFVALPGPGRADRLPPDPVAELKRVLTATLDKVIVRDLAIRELEKRTRKRDPAAT